MIAGIVLAAGRSRRMGRPKPLLRLDGASFVESVTAALRDGGCDPVVVVRGDGSDADAEVQRLARDAGARVVINRHPGSEQIDSLRLALQALPPTSDAAVVAPVDVPLVTAALVARLIARARESGAPITVPVRDGRHGHPVVFARAVFPELLTTDGPDGARAVVHAHQHELAEVPADESDVLTDVDTRADYERIRSRPR